MSDLITIGMFSRSSQLTVKALRNYHSSGLLVPAEVDPVTGYRAYHVGQLADAAVIRKLRQLEVSLEDISTIMAERNPDTTAKLLEQHLSTMEERLATTRTIVDGLLVGNEQPATLTPPTVIDVDHRHVVAVTGTVGRDSYAEFLGQAFQTLFAAVAQSGTPVTGPAGACYPPQVTDYEEVMAYIPIAEPFDTTARGGVTVAELPARRVASITYRGSYDDIADAYLALGRWVALNATALEEPVRELYLVSYYDTDDPSEFVTEIHWPVTERKQQ